ncbi:hypothetical protein ABZ071_31760, partial [Micromonospora fulviviridis]
KLIMLPELRLSIDRLLVNPSPPAETRLGQAQYCSRPVQLGRGGGHLGPDRLGQCTTTGSSTPCTCRPAPRSCTTPAVRAYDELRARDVSHPAAPRQIGNRLVDILHGCLTSNTHYDQATANQREVRLQRTSNSHSE